MHTPFPDRRRASRLDCEIPILLRCGERVLHTLGTDLSRVGTLVRIPLQELGLHRGVPLAELSRETMRLLGDRVTLELDHESLGALVARTARPIRFARVHAGQDYVEVGLALRQPITDLEVEFLGLPLEPLLEPLEEDAVNVHSCSAHGGAKQVKLVLSAESGRLRPPLRLVPGRFDATGAHASLGRVNALPVLIDRPGAAGIMAALAEVYGARPHAVVLIQAEQIWAGNVCLEAIDLRPEDQQVMLEMSFTRPISGPARTRLGLALG